MANESDKEVFSGDLYFNGVNGATGAYGLPPMSGKRLAQFIQGKGQLEDLEALVDEQKQKQLEEMTEEAKQREAQEERIGLAELKDKRNRQTHLGDFPVKEGVDPTDLAQAGWAVVFPAMMDSERKRKIKDALKPLLELRQGQAEANGKPLFRIFEDGAGYRPGERKDQFFTRQSPEIRQGPADPVQMPFYVLLVGSPEEIPYKFQFQLDVMRGVGRIDFGDDYGACHRYAQSMVMAETGKVKLPRRASLFGVVNPNDGATQLSAQWLVRPLYENLQKLEIDAEIPLEHPWQLDIFVGKNQATKKQLKRLLSGDEAESPALLFTASHGMEFPLNHPLQLAHQGALLCQDWGGPGTAVTPDHYFAGEDLKAANVTGMMAMFFACYGAGTPRLDHFAQQAFKARAPIAPYGFVGALPQRLLGQGALAVIGHVERAWGYSFISPGNHLDNQAFVTALRKMLNGEPVGLATDPSFDLRYAAMSSNLSQALEDLLYVAAGEAPTVNEYELAHMWTSTSDARNYVVVGDPAAKLPVADVASEGVERPTITVAYQAPEPDVTAAIYSADTTAEAEPRIEQPTPEARAASVPGALTISGTINLQPAGAAPATEYAPPAAMDYARIGWPFRGDREEDEEQKEERKKLGQSIQEFVQNAAKAVANAAKEAATLQVVTYTIEDISEAELKKWLKQDPEEPKEFENEPKPRAITRISLDGDIRVFVPEKDGEIDIALWELHSDMVQQAQENRNAIIKIVVEAVGGLVPG